MVSWFTTVSFFFPLFSYVISLSETATVTSSRPCGLGNG